MGFVGWNLFMRVVCYGVPFVVCFFVFELFWLWSAIAAAMIGMVLVKIWFSLSVLRGVSGDSEREKRLREESQKKNLLKKSRG